MGGAKKMMMEDDARRHLAAEILVESGALTRCEFHEDPLLDGNEDVESAYRLANAKFTKNELKGAFEDRRQMTDTIKSVYEENSGGECYSCAKWERD